MKRKSSETLEKYVPYINKRGCIAQLQGKLLVGHPIHIPGVRYG